MTSGLFETEHQTIGELRIAIDTAMRVSLEGYSGDKVTAHAVKVRSILVSERQYLAVQFVFHCEVWPRGCVRRDTAISIAFYGVG